MNTLSVIKVPIMVQAFRDHAAGRLDLDQRHVVEADDMRRGSGLIQTFAPGLNPTARGLVTQMIVTSDNTATDMIVELVGIDRVNELLASNGYRETRVKHTTGRLFLETWIRADSANVGLTPREVFERGFPSDSGAAQRSFEIEGDSTIWLGRTTAREMGRPAQRAARRWVSPSAAPLAAPGGRRSTSRRPAGALRSTRRGARTSSRSCCRTRGAGPER